MYGVQLLMFFFNQTKTSSKLIYKINNNISYYFNYKFLDVKEYKAI